MLQIKVNTSTNQSIIGLSSLPPSQGPSFTFRSHFFVVYPSFMSHLHSIGSLVEAFLKFLLTRLIDGLGNKIVRTFRFYSIEHWMELEIYF